MIERNYITQFLPIGAPKIAFDASERVYSTTTPEIDDLRIMMILEASGHAAYAELARLSEIPFIKIILMKNSREELAHAHRIKKAIRILTGMDYLVPPPEDNPYFEPRNDRLLTSEGLLSMAKSERRGEALYTYWAESTVSQDVAALFRRNGLEERGHANRLEEAAALLNNAESPSAPAVSDSNLSGGK